MFFFMSSEYRKGGDIKLNTLRDGKKEVYTWGCSLCLKCFHAENMRFSHQKVLTCEKDAEIK
jgi:hypothetical protein